MKHIARSCRYVTPAVCIVVWQMSVFCVAAGADTVPDIVRGDIGRKLDTYLTRATFFGFSGVVAATRDDSILLRKGYGLADRERGVTFTSGTAIDIGSLAKQFTAAAILKLEAQGRCSTTDPIIRFFDRIPEDKRAITIHQLLTHTSGVVRDVSIDGESREVVVRQILSMPLRLEPGARFAYSNAGYKLLAAIVEVVSGERFDVFIRRVTRRIRWF